MSEAKQTEQNLHNEIDKEIQKLVYYTESFDETRNEGDLDEMKITRDRGTAIVEKINTLVVNCQELKIEHGETARNVRQWRKEIKEKYMPLVEGLRKFSEAYDEKQQQINDEIERKKNKKQSVRKKNVISNKYETAKEKLGKRNLMQNYE